MTNTEKYIVNPEKAAKYFKFHLQSKNSNLKFVISLDRIQVKSFYKTYCKEFYNLFDIFVKYNLDITKYIHFFIDVLDKREKDIKNDLLSNESITKYVNWLKLRDKQDKIYEYFLKSVENIANDCIELGYFSTKDYIRYLIKSKKISEYYISGKISLYYFTAIPNFKKIIPKLDLFSRQEFKKIYDRFEMYNKEINDVFMLKKKQKVNPIQFTDKFLYEKRNKQ